MGDIKLSAIVAMAENRVIGKDNTLLWHLPEDFKHFKRTTMGNPMIMGRKTFESLPGMLPGRPHIVITRTPPQKEKENLHYVTSLDDAISLGKQLTQKSKKHEVFVIGGGEIYKQCMSKLDRLYLTLVHNDYDGDTKFPEINWDEWNVENEEHIEGDPPFTIMTLNRKQ